MSKLPETGPSLLRHLRQQQRLMLRQAQSSAFTRSGANVSHPGMLSSDDFDGVDRDHLGTSGWALGSVDGGPSYLVLNGRDVFADLAAKDAALTAQQASLAAQLASINALVADLASRVTVTATIGTFNTGTLPNDATFHPYGSSIPITIAVPTGKLTVTVGCGDASLNSGGAQVEADATFSISGGVASMEDFWSGGYLASASTGVGVPLNMQRAFTVTPGTYTVTGRMYAWAAGTATASVNFQQPFLTVQVTG